MATSTIKLYYGTALHPWELTANKFFVIDDIATYLATYTPTEFTNFQYQKCSLEMAILCDLSQTYVEPLLANGIKYVSIKNSDGNKTYYYYVKKAEWRGKQSVKLYLVMDVANTFRAGTDFNFTEKTKITREHKDRMIKKRTKTRGSISMEASEGTISIEAGDIITLVDIESDEDVGHVKFLTAVHLTYYESMDDIEFEAADEEAEEYFETHGAGDFGFRDVSYEDIYDEVITQAHDYFLRNIDLQSEGLSPLLYKKAETTIYREGILNCDWFLLYRNQNNPTEALTNPVECYLIPSQDIDVNVGSMQSGGRITPDNLELGKYYYIPLVYHQTKTLTLSTGLTISSGDVAIVQKVDDTHIVVNKTKEINSGGLTYIEIADTYICEYFNISALPCKYKIRNSIDTSYTYTEFTSDSFPRTWTTDDVPFLTIDNIDRLDRTDAKNIKLIKLPYVPYDFSVENDVLNISDTDWEHVSLTQANGGVIEILKLKNLNIKFNYNFKLIGSPLSPLSLDFDPDDFENTDLRNDDLESKIYHSDYYQPKFVYDSFGYVFQLERMDIDFYNELSDQEHMEIKYVVSTTINSRFMFQFTDYYSEVAKEDYNNVMPVARNNEIVLYNVPYINYIRTGYNYDVKNKNAQAVSTWASVGLGAAGTFTALMFPTAALKIAGVVASLISTAISVKNAIASQVQAERNLDEKMLNAKNQSTSVSGSDDVDLMSVYTENRAKMCLYECSDVIKELIYDLFYYTGYVSNRMGLPNTHTRLNFDYLEADIIITDNVNMSDEIMNELVGIYKNGLTFIHNVSERVSEPWDLSQKYENIELSVI